MTDTLPTSCPFPGLDLEIERIRRGRYADQCFNLARDFLTALDAEGAGFGGKSRVLLDQGLTELEIASAEPGRMEAETQFSCVSETAALLSGVRLALYILREAAGSADDEPNDTPAWKGLEVEAVPEGCLVHPGRPALRVRGLYRDFAHLETVILGILARATRVATNTYHTLEASNGKPVYFFPARCDFFLAQPLDGYAYKTAVEAYNQLHGAQAPALVSTAAQSSWWNGEGGGTQAHPYYLCFLRDAAEAALAFARLAPPEARRVALVDVNNDCVGDSLAVAKALFGRYRELYDDGRTEEAARFKLEAVHCDTAPDMRDNSVAPLGDPRLDCGVTPRLVFDLRKALDEAPQRMDLPLSWHHRARRYFREIRIIVSGGFTPKRVRLFEQLGAPVDAYGVGAALLHRSPMDFTADMVRVKVAGRWLAMAKEGRRALPNPDLRPVDLQSLSLQ